MPRSGDQIDYYEFWPHEKWKKIWSHEFDLMKKWILISWNSTSWPWVQLSIRNKLRIAHCTSTLHTNTPCLPKKLNFPFCVLWFLSTTSHEQCFLVDDFFISVLIDLRSRNFNKKQHSHSFVNKENSKLTLIVLLKKRMCWKVIHNTHSN